MKILKLLITYAGLILAYILFNIVLLLSFVKLAMLVE